MGGSNTTRIVILGKTGAGKSSLGSTIFGEEVFNPGHSASPETKKCQAKTRSVNGRSITLIDTPGFFGTNESEEELKSEMVRCITECTPGPHAFLIILKVERFAEQEQAVISKIQNRFSEEAFKYATVVFTHGEQLREGQTIKDFVRENKHLSDLVDKCGGRCHVVDNKYWIGNPEDEDRSNQVQVEELLKAIDEMVEDNNGNCYTNEMLQTVENVIQQEAKQIRQSSPNMSEEEIREKAKKPLIRLAGLGTGALLGAFLGEGVMVAVAVTALMNIAPLKPLVVKALGGAGAAGAAGGAAAAAAGSAEGVAAAGGAAAAGAAGGVAAGGAAAIVVVGAVGAVGAGLGGVAGFHAAKGAETVGEAVEMAAKAVMGKAVLALKEARDFSEEVFQSKSKQS